MGGSDRGLLLKLLRYVSDESLDKRGRPLDDPQQWVLRCSEMDVTPRQTNGYVL